MAKGSQYTESYLRENARRGFGKGVTVGTFLAYNLRGRAKNYGGRYADALNNDLNRRVKVGEVVGGVSAGNSIAFYPLDTPQTVVRAFGGDPFPVENKNGENP